MKQAWWDKYWSDHWYVMRCYDILRAINAILRWFGYCRHCRYRAKHNRPITDDWRRDTKKWHHDQSCKKCMDAHWEAEHDRAVAEMYGSSL